jgi:tellurite resistance protein
MIRLSQLTYETIQSIVLHSECTDDRVRVTFRCPDSGVEVTSEARLGIPFEDPPIDSPMTMLERLRSAVLGLAVSLFLPSQANEPYSPPLPPQTTAREAAVVLAFSQVRDQFAWDVTTRQWRARDVIRAPESQLLLDRATIKDPRDQALLLRMLAEVAMADNELAACEKRFFDQFSQGLLRFDTAANRKPLRAEEFARLSPSQREAYLMLSIALACLDGDYAPSERHKLDFFRQCLDIPSERAAELDRMAREYMLDELMRQAHSSDTSELDRGAARMIAAKMQLPPELVAQYEARHARDKQSP